MPETPISVANVLATLILGGFLGLLGQGARAIVGLKGLQDQVDNPDASRKDVFSAARLLMSLMIGFLAGLAATLAMGIGKLLHDPTNIDVLLGIAGAGYVGTDFIEGFMSRFVPTSKPSAPAKEQAENAPSTVALGSQYHAAVMDAAFKFEDLVAKRTAVAPALQCGNVRGGSTKPDDLTIRTLVLQAAGRADLDPKKTDDKIPLSHLVGGAGGDYIWFFAQHCQFDFEPFNTDQLSLDARYVTAHGTTLGDFVKCIKCCYDHARPGRRRP